MNGDAWKLGFALVLAGFAVILATIPLFLLTSPQSAVNVGGCIVILFVPVCFGYGPQAPLMVLASIIAALVLIVVSFLVWKSLTRSLNLKREYYSVQPN
ncbi:MAG: hypothetical protein NZ954_01760 [Thermofilaceae archaeon]|nr:hypothetical protein [Thermofilaceae archaeon]MCX8180406.1 hypothetical protein [Thermofilaceae archaeon]MDW8003397.1 hypothetical protein [Thermofilaceae archaeon]